MTYRRRTLAAPVRLTGRALHSGHPVRMVIHPAEDGIAFRHGHTRTLARPSSVDGTTRCTRLGGISTVEHLMSAFAGRGITDAEVELSYPELPGFDGSASEFVHAIDSGGVARIDDLPVPRLRGQITVQHGPAVLSVRPGTGRWSYTFDLSRWSLGSQTVRCQLPEDYQREVAPARTIAFADEIPTALAQGLGRGLDVRSVVIIGADGYENEPRFPDEPARHKLLDLIGDLYLSGIPVHGVDVVAHASGHTMAVRAAALAGSRRGDVQVC
jgi:UDP-3-O-[3-hydroxymyristoyl] N-acetylglucosamine deacetylase